MNKRTDRDTNTIYGPNLVITQKDIQEYHQFMLDNQDLLGDGEWVAEQSPELQDKMMIEMEALGLTHLINYKRLVEVNLQRPDAIDLQQYRLEFNLKLKQLSSKVCTRCNQDKPRDEFYSKGEDTYCKTCRGKSNNESQIKQMEKRRINKDLAQEGKRMCGACHQVLPLTEFYWREVKREYASNCNVCVAEYQKKYREIKKK